MHHALFFSISKHPSGVDDAASWFADKQLDVNIVPTDRRRKQILIADMDNTTITNESPDDLAALAVLANAVSATTKRAMAGEIDFECVIWTC